MVGERRGEGGEGCGVIRGGIFHGGLTFVFCTGSVVVSFFSRLGRG